MPRLSVTTAVCASSLEIHTGGSTRPSSTKIIKAPAPSTDGRTSSTFPPRRVPPLDHTQLCSYLVAGIFHWCIWLHMRVSHLFSDPLFHRSIIRSVLLLLVQNVECYIFPWNLPYQSQFPSLRALRLTFRGIQYPYHKDQQPHSARYLVR